MSTTSVYFVPEAVFPVGQFTEMAKSLLEKLKIIDGYYDEDAKQYAMSGKIEFEYASIHDTDKKKIVPEGSSSGYGATCSNCKADIDEELYDTLNNYYELEYDSDEEKDMTTLMLTCNKCTSSFSLENIKFNLPVLFANQYFQFVDIDDEISPDLLHEIQTQLNTGFKIIYERM